MNYELITDIKCEPYELIEQQETAQYDDFFNNNISELAPELKPLNTNSRICEICKLSFTRYESLMRHYVVHSGEKNFQCKLCQQKFTQLGSLTRHEKKHSEANKFVCFYCNKKYSRKSILEIHLRIHSKAKPFACETCDCRFSRVDHFNRHRRKHQLLKCQRCLVKFENQQELKQHASSCKCKHS